MNVPADPAGNAVAVSCWPIQAAGLVIGTVWPSRPVPLIMGEAVVGVRDVLKKPPRTVAVGERAVR